MATARSTRSTVRTSRTINAPRSTRPHSSIGNERLFVAKVERQAKRAPRMVESPETNLLSVEDELALARATRAGDAAARERFIQANVRLVAHIAGRYSADRQAVNCEFDDLVQEGMFGLMHAVDRYDPESGFRFSTYATWWIRQSISRALINNGHAIRVPVHMHERIQRIKRLRLQLTAQTGQTPDVASVAQRLDLTEADVREALAFQSVARDPASLDATLTYARGAHSSHIGELFNLAELIPDHQAEDRFAAAEARADALGASSLQSLIRGLLAREAEFATQGRSVRRELDMMVRRYVGGRTLDAIAQEVGLSHERVRQLSERGLNLLREEIEATQAKDQKDQGACDPQRRSGGEVTA